MYFHLLSLLSLLLVFQKNVEATCEGASDTDCILFSEDFESGSCTTQLGIKTYKSIYRSDGNLDVYKCLLQEAFYTCCVELVGTIWGSKWVATGASLKQGYTYYIDVYATAHKKPFVTFELQVQDSVGDFTSYYHVLSRKEASVPNPTRHIVPFTPKRNSEGALSILLMNLPSPQGEAAYGVLIDNLQLRRCDTDHYIFQGHNLLTSNNMYAMGCKTCKTTEIANLGGCFNKDSVASCIVEADTRYYGISFTKISCSKAIVGNYLDSLGVSHSCKTDDIANAGNCLDAQSVKTCSGAYTTQGIACSNCKAGFRLNSLDVCVCGTQIIAHCKTYVNNVQFCSSSGQRPCQECDANYYLNPNQLSCELCGDGNYVTSSNECQKCRETIPHCEVYSVTCTATQSKTCVKCFNGYYKDSIGLCQPCSTPSNCRETDLTQACKPDSQQSNPFNSVCKKCQLGFALKNEKCEQCGAVDFCANYDYTQNQCGIGNKNICSQCIPSYTLNKITNACEKCHDQSDCVGYTNNCIFRNAENKYYKECIQCNVGLNLNTTTNKCDTCLSDIANCAKLTNVCDRNSGRYYCEKCESNLFLNFDGLSCKSCEKGYYVENNICKPCKFDVSHCKEYNIQKSCVFDINNENSVELECTQCDTGFYLNNTKTCSACSTETQNCNIYEENCNSKNEKNCKSCYSKYYLSDYNICSPCSEDVQRCGRFADECNDANSTDCLECFSGYYLDISGKTTECRECTDVVENCNDYFTEQCSSITSNQKRCKQCAENMAVSLNNNTNKWECSTCNGVVIDGIECVQSAVDNNNNGSNGNTSLSGGAIAGIVCGVFVLVVVMSVGIFFLAKKAEKIRREKELYGMSAKEFVMSTENSQGVLLQTDAEYENANPNELNTSNNYENGVQTSDPNYASCTENDNIDSSAETENYQILDNYAKVDENSNSNVDSDLDYHNVICD